MQHEFEGRPQLSTQFALQPCGVQHVLVRVTHSPAPEHPHRTVCPQLSTRVTPHAPPHGSVGVQQDF
jgi:hypothetical protein